MEHERSEGKSKEESKHQESSHHEQSVSSERYDEENTENEESENHRDDESMPYNADEESGKLMTYYLTQDNETQKLKSDKEEELLKSSNKLLSLVDEFISEDLSRKHKDMSNISENIGATSKELTSSISEIFSQTNTKILESLVKLQKSYNYLVEEKRRMSQEIAELNVKCEILETDKKNNDKEIYDTRTELTKKDDLEQKLNMDVTNLTNQVSDLKSKLTENKKHYNKLSEEIIRRTALMDELSSQFELEKALEDRTTKDTDYKKELEVNYKWSLKDLNSKLNVKEEKILSLGMANNELKQKVAQLQQEIQKLERE